MSLNATVNAAVGTCYLLKLPPELRNYIYTLVVVDKDPLPAYLARRTVLPPRSDASSSQSYKRRTIVERKIFPLNPSLAATSKQLRGEVLPIFYSENIFIFNIAGSYTHSSGSVWRWDMALDGSENICRIILEFDMVDPHWATQPLAQNNIAILRLQTKRHAAEIAFTSKANRDLSVVTGGKLSEQCTCTLERGFKATEIWLGDQMTHNLAVWVADCFETDHYPNFKQRREVVGEGRCAECGKERFTVTYT